MIKLKLTLPPFFRKGIFAKKSVRLLFDVVKSIVGLVFVILLLLLGRLSMGPLTLDFLTPEVEAAFKVPQAGVSATIEHTQLVWREWKRPFEIELVNVHLQKGQNPHWLHIEHVGVSLRLYHLFGGEVSLKQIRLYRPHILLERDEKGEFTLGFGETVPSQEFSFKDVAPLLALGVSNPAIGKLNEVNKISIIEAHILLKDEQEDQSWELPKTTFVLKRHVGGFRTDLTLHPQKGSGALTLSLSHRLGSPRFDIEADFQDIAFKNLIEKDRPVLSLPRPEAITPDDVLNFLHHWDIPLQGKVHVALVPGTLQVVEGGCDLTIGKGELDLSLAKLLPLPVDSGNLSFALSPQGVEIKNASLLSHEMLLQFSGNLASPAAPLCLKTLLGPGQSLEVQGKIEDLFLDHLAALWPEGLAPHPRKWLTQNLRTGTLTQATFLLKGYGAEDGFILDTLKGTLEGEEAEVTYLEGLPPAQHVKANATFDQKGFDIHILSGNVEHIQLQKGHIIISGLDQDKEALTLDIHAKGPLPDFLDVINHEPLEYATYGGIDPKKAKGEGVVNFHVAFPLLADLQFKDVKMAIKGGIKKVSLERMITEELTAQLTQGAFSLDLTQDQMMITGKGILNQLPSILTYTHSFKESTPTELQIAVETLASFEDFKRLGFDYGDYGKGPAKTNLTYVLERDKKSRLLVDLDTTSTFLSFPPLGWEKKPGEKGKLSFSLIFKEGHLEKLKDLKMSSPSYALEGAVLFGPQKAWKAIYLSEFKGPHTNTQVTFLNPRANTYEVSFKGHSVNLEKFLDYLNQEEAATDRPPLTIKLLADVDALRLGEGKVFQNVKASADLFLQGKDTTWKAVSLRAKAGQGTAYKGDMAKVSGGISLDIIPGADNTKTLEVRANDAGQFLKNLSIYEEIQGGYITIKAQKKGQGPYVGIFKMKEFNANEVPLLARFAALLSPMGIANLFSANKTLSMDRFECDFDYHDDFITVKNGVGKSLSLGFTVDGKLNRKDQLYALKGNIIPARFLNSILCNIPLIGPLLSGGKGEGLFAISYTVKGPFYAPDVSLNPLSALAPGFIRKLFQSLGEEE